MNKFVKEFFFKYKLSILGIIIGAISGYLYFYFIGCSTGACPIISHPWRMTFYGALLGGLLFDIFRKESKINKQNNEKTF